MKTHALVVCHTLSTTWCSQLFPSSSMTSFNLGLLICSLMWICSSAVIVERTERSIKDESVSDYLTERVCWWNEVCKEEFQTQFRCKCPVWSFCRSPGRYYKAVCSVAETGYIWHQPASNVGLPPGS